MEPVEEFDVPPCTVKIYTEEDPLDPRKEFDSFGKMICFHRNYALGDKHDFEYSPDLPDILRKDHDALIILPLHLYDHSGLTMNTTGFSCPWDSGQVGVTYCTKADALKAFGAKKITKALIKRATDILISEVNTYDLYLRGEVYMYEIEEYGEPVDSCCGYYGLEDCMSSAREAAAARNAHMESTTLFGRKEARVKG